MNDKTLLCLGCGYTAQHFAEKLISEGWSVTGTTRSNENAEALKDIGITPFIWSDDLDPQLVQSASAILVSTPPAENDCPAFRAVSAEIIKQADSLKWIGYLSTNGVYGDHNGEWVNEASSLCPTTKRAHRRIAAEKDWLSLRSEHSLPVVVFRLPGIYGPGRSALDTVRQGRAKRILKKGQVFSRAHVADIAAALYASLNNPSAGHLFNIADDEPAPPQDVIDYACKLLGVTPPPLIPFEEADLSEMGRSFYQDNKRVRNDRVKTQLHVNLKYPTYREGLNALHAEETSQP